MQHPGDGSDVCIPEILQDYALLIAMPSSTIPPDRERFEAGHGALFTIAWNTQQANGPLARISLKLHGCRDPECAWLCVIRPANSTNTCMQLKSAAARNPPDFTKPLPNASV